MAEEDESVRAVDEIQCKRGRQHDYGRTAFLSPAATDARSIFPTVIDHH